MSAEACGLMVLSLDSLDDSVDVEVVFSRESL